MYYSHLVRTRGFDKPWRIVSQSHSGKNSHLSIVRTDNETPTDAGRENNRSKTVTAAQIAAHHDESVKILNTPLSERITTPTHVNRDYLVGERIHPAIIILAVLGMVVAVLMMMINN